MREGERITQVLRKLGILPNAKNDNHNNHNNSNSTQTLEGCLKHSDFSTIFWLYLKEQYQNEVLNFLLDVEYFKVYTNENEIVIQSLLIYNKYLTAGEENELAFLSDELRNTMEQQKNQGLSKSSFDLLLTAAWNILEESFIKFTSSDIYIKYKGKILKY